MSEKNDAKLNNGTEEIETGEQVVDQNTETVEAVENNKPVRRNERKQKPRVVAVEETELEEDESEEESLSEQMASDDYVINGVTQGLFNQMTNKNQQFMIAVDRQLADHHLAESAKAAVYFEMVETLIQGQASSQTARHLYGTPTEAANVILEQELPSDEIVDDVKSPDWQIALDGALILGSIYVALTGLSLVNNATEESLYQSMGIITVIVNYIAAGFAMLAISKVIPNPDAPKGEKGYFRYFGISIVAMIGWVLVVVLTSTFIPPVVNIPLPGEVLLGLGVITFLLRFYLKRKLKIRGGIF